jgi:ABC-type cobalamin/Fe3+-siderophores transport system ATPase subunit
MKAGEIYATGAPEGVLTRENIREVYGADVLPTRHPRTGALYFFTFCTDTADSPQVVGAANNEQHQEAAAPLTSKEDPYAA